MSTLHVVFKVAEAEYVLAAADVLQMDSYQGATAVPGTPPYVAGVVQVRGRVVPIVDLRVRFGLPPITPTLDSRIVVAELRDRIVGLLVDSAREIVKLAPAQIAPPPRVMDGADGFVKAVAHLDKRLLMLIDFAKVIGEETAHGN